MCILYITYHVCILYITHYVYIYIYIYIYIYTHTYVCTCIGIMITRTYKQYISLRNVNLLASVGSDKTLCGVRRRVDAVSRENSSSHTTCHTMV